MLTNHNIIYLFRRRVAHLLRGYPSLRNFGGTTVSDINPEMIAIIFGGISGLTGIITLAWKKFLKPIVNLCKNQDFFKESVESIKKELCTNGGSSLKDAIIDIKETVNIIDARQKVIVQRTKAALHYSSMALFETDKEGRLIWSNANLIELTKKSSNGWKSNASYMIEGFDWISLFKEDEREDVLSEFKSCLSMNRRFIKETELINGVKVRLLGYPYKLTEAEHGGFLVSITETETEV